MPKTGNRTYVRIMVNTRKNEDGFRGEYPGPLDWDAIERELLAKQGGDRVEDEAPED